MVQLEYREAKPIYEQIKQGLRRLVVSRAIAADEKLPSVRELAARLAINPNTIQRAYRELENEGYLYSLPGKGTFAAGETTALKDRQEDLLGQFDELVSELLFLSISADNLADRIHHLDQGGTVL